MFEQQTMTAAAFCLNLNHLFLRMHVKTECWAFSGIWSDQKGHGESQADEMKNILVVFLYREIFMQFYHIERKKFCDFHLQQVEAFHKSSVTWIWKKTHNVLEVFQ